MEKKGFMNEFKEFISRGNVMDMAVGVIIGGAFTAIVTSLVNDILMPIIGGLLSGVDFTQLVATMGSATITYGNFIQAIINFLLIAWVVFMLVRTLNKMKRKEEEAPAPAPAPAEPSEEILLLREIRDSLKK
ncbi:MAG: large-conductance mechanosensitive channel protein MscL [Clostridiales bacterium]|nr:large-conductance mechanosensitive channel protein MscL [Clostridiales bacterium]